MAFFQPHCIKYIHKRLKPNNISISHSSKRHLSATLNLDKYSLQSLPNKWRQVYAQLNIKDPLKDEYNAFISPPTIDSITSQLNNLQTKLEINPTDYPLTGMPIIIKDNIMTKHSLHPTTNGSTAFKNFKAPKNASIVDSIIDLGGIVFGKSNLHEFALGITSNNQGYGCCINPIDPTRICGGSSGGNAAAISAGYATFGVGTDTGSVNHNHK